MYVGSLRSCCRCPFRSDFTVTVYAEEAEVSFQSCDGVRFRIHINNLKACSGTLAPPSFTTFGEIVTLTESSTILEILFQFLYNQRRLDLGSVEFKILESLAEAAEKYQVYPAMSMCKIYMT